MADVFTEITDPLKHEGMSAEDTTLETVKHNARLSATYYLTLKGMGLKLDHCLDLTHHWLDLCNGVEDDDEED
jgi:hypothetical protein